MRFKGRVPVARKQPLEQRHAEKFTLAQRNVFYIEGIFGVIVAVLRAVKGNGRVVEKAHLVKVAADCAHADFKLLCKVVRVRI